MLSSLVGWVLTSLTAVSIAYCLITIVVARRRVSNQRPTHWPQALPPATLLIPLCGVDFRAYDNYASFCRLDYPEFQIVFGVQDPEDSSIPVVHRIMDEFPHRDIELVISSKTIGQNPKVNNLNNMLARARHPWLVLVDSDMRVREDYLRQVVPSAGRDPQTGLATCLYRAGTAPNFAARIEALGIATDFTTGVMMAEFMEGISFAFGATIVIHKGKLEALGGFEAVADHLADDYMLGHLLWKKGCKIHLVPYVVETILPASSFKGMLKHQIRWARGIRACRPAGHAASIVTHTLPIALLNVAANGGSFLSLVLLGLAAAARFTSAWTVGVKILGDATTKENLHLLPLRDGFALFIWCMSIWGSEVEWRGKRYQIVEDGKMQPL